MYEGEEFDIIEEDQGDGWTRVRRKTGGQRSNNNNNFNNNHGCHGDRGENLDDTEGFVPTSYLYICQN